MTLARRRNKTCNTDSDYTPHKSLRAFFRSSRNPQFFPTRSARIDSFGNQSEWV